MKRSDYCAVANRYIEDVLSGKQIACEWVKLACKRQKKDLAAKNFAYEFVEAEAARVCSFIENLTHIKGELAGQKIHLEPWQVFILTTAFGWKRKSDGGRRFRRVYIEVPRGNGKSSLSSGVALYCLLADREPGAEVYSFATTRDQAKIVFGDAKVMAEQNKALQSHFGCAVLANALYVAKTNSTFQAKSAEGSTLDGLNTHCAIVDELHAHKTRAVYDVVETSLGKRRSSLLWCITTAGFDISGICYEVRTMTTKVLKGEVRDDTQFGIIYTIDEGDDWTSEEALMKANPNWGISVRPEMITSLLKKAKALPSAINNFKTKHLDIWCSASDAWMDMAAWHRCASEDLSLEDFEGRSCFIGLDLGAKNDITAKVRIFPRRDEVTGKTVYYVFGDYFLPQAAVENSTNSQYSGWQITEDIHVTEGAVTDFAVISEAIREDLSRFNVQSIAYDPWQATQLATELNEDGAPMVEYRNTVANLSDPMKWLEALIQDGRLVHNGDPVLTWMMGNVVAKRDNKDNIFPRKERYENKIDGVVALIFALGMCVNEEKSNSGFTDYESTEIPIFEW